MQQYNLMKKIKEENHKLPSSTGWKLRNAYDMKLAPTSCFSMLVQEVNEDKSVKVEKEIPICNWLISIE